MTRFTLTIPVELDTWLTQQAKKNSLSKIQYINQILEQHWRPYKTLKLTIPEPGASFYIIDAGPGERE